MCGEESLNRSSENADNSCVLDPSLRHVWTREKLTITTSRHDGQAWLGGNVILERFEIELYFCFQEFKT